MIPLVHTKCLVLRGGLVGLLMLTMLGSQRGAGILLTWFLLRRLISGGFRRHAGCLKTCWMLYLIPLVHTKCLVLREGLGWAGLLRLLLTWFFAETLDFRRLDSVRLWV